MSIERPGTVETLRSIRAFAQVFKYLADERGWPLDTDALDEDDLESLTYDWDPQELGISPGGLGALRRLRQMRPVTAGQPWGVFFLEFTGARLPITQVRRILRALVARKRASGNGSRPSWRLDDLLFIVSTGAGGTMELHLITFRGDSPQGAEFRSLSWRTDTPTGHLRRLAEELLPCLDWPDDVTDVASWRAAWREAFKLPAGQAIRDAARLAERMARTALDLRHQIAAALDSEQGSGPFSTLMGDVRSQLVSDVDVERFADMCAQTLTYGVLSSRVTDPDGFGSSPIFSSVPLANPFLEAFFEQVHDQAVSLDLSGSGLPQLVADLRETDVESILTLFGSTAKGGDPVIHFYEEFLKRYDSKMRADAGAFYTPKPVVEFMVRMVDEVLRTRFGLPLGIADSATWQEVADRNEFAVPDGVDSDKPFVSMIDPATGTGTFLVEWLRRARDSYVGAAEPGDRRSDAGAAATSPRITASAPGTGDWSRHLREHVLPSMHAFENMLAPYAIAHLKVALELHDAGLSGSSTQILLTDTLDHRAAQGQFGMMQNPIAAEGERAADLKESERFTVVIGNPPYDLETRDVGDSRKRKGGVVRHGAPGIAPLLNAVTVPMKTARLGHHLKRVYNDYIYFWRWAIWQAVELPDGPGIVAFITASSYLDGVTMGGVRHLLRRTFDEIWIIDLGGEGRGARVEENVFDIRTPVAVAIGVRIARAPADECADQTPAEECTVRYLRIAGSRAEKLDRLRRIRLEDVSENVAGKSLDRFTPRSGSEYYEWPEICDLFPWCHSGCLVVRVWPIGETKAVLERRWQELLDNVPRRRGALLRETRDRKASSSPRHLFGSRDRLRPLIDLDIGDQPESIERYGYRSFDRQWIIADNRVADYPRPDLWRVRCAHQLFLTTLTSTKVGRGPALTVTPYLPDYDHFRGSYGAKNVMPLYRDPTGRLPNVAEGLLDVIGDRLGTEVSPEDLLAYVHAVAGTAAFTERFEDELAEAAGPIHLPITANQALFQQAVALGRDLLWWHTWGERFTSPGQTRLPPGRAQQITPVDGMPEKYHYDADTRLLTLGTGTFGPVSPEVWNFEVSGLKVVDSWLGYRMKTRKGRKSSDLDNIRPTRWTQTDELLRLLAILDHTIELTPTAAALLDEILANPLIPAIDLPTPTPDQRKPLK